MWKCPKCKEKCEDNFDSCWSCGTKRDNTPSTLVEPLPFVDPVVEQSGLLFDPSPVPSAISSTTPKPSTSGRRSVKSQGTDYTIKGARLLAQKTSIDMGWIHLASGLVIISYFLVWHKSWGSSETGFAIVGSALKDLDNIKGDSALLGLAMFSFILSPLVCHALNLLLTLTNENKKTSFVLSSIPVAIWLGAVLVLLIKSNGDISILEMFFPHEIGAQLLMAGMAISVVLSGLNYYDEKKVV